MGNMALVNVHELNKVVDVHCRSINILDARREAEELYKAVKLYGYENVKQFTSMNLCVLTSVLEKVFRKMLELCLLLEL